MFRKKQPRLLTDTQFLLNTLTDGVVIVDPAGKIIATNKAAATMLDSSQQELLGQHCLAPFGALNEDGKPITKSNAALYDAIVNGEKTLNATRQFTTGAEKNFWASIAVTPYTSEKKRHGAIIVFRDITVQKQQEEYQTDFAHVASHQLRSPISNLRWAIEAFIEDNEATLSADQKEQLNSVEHILKDVNRLVNELLHVSKLHNKEVEPGDAKTDALDILQRVYRDLEHYASASNVTLEPPKKRGFKTKSLPLRVNQTHLRTMMQNLVENAIRYSFPKSSVSVTLTKEADHVTIACTNIGIGIEPADKQYIFSKFYRAKNAVEKQGDGTGLGLYVTHHLAELYKGTLTFESDPGNETTFYLTLPLYGKKK